MWTVPFLTVGHRRPTSGLLYYASATRLDPCKAHGVYLAIPWARVSMPSRDSSGCDRLELVGELESAGVGVGVGFSREKRCDGRSRARRAGAR